jgi:hypothetical protein
MILSQPHTPHIHLTQCQVTCNTCAAHDGAASVPHTTRTNNLKESCWQVVDARRSNPWRHLLGEAAPDGSGGSGLTVVELRILARGDADAAALEVIYNAFGCAGKLAQNVSHYV